jgi:hypothetical protein
MSAEPPSSRAAAHVRIRRGSAARAPVDKSPIGEDLQWVRNRFAAIVVGARSAPGSRLQPRLGLKASLAGRSIVGGVQ